MAGGREMHLRSLQSTALAVAYSLFLGDYLTSEGQDARRDLEMISAPDTWCWARRASIRPNLQPACATVPMPHRHPLRHRPPAPCAAVAAAAPPRVAARWVVRSNQYCAAAAPARRKTPTHKCRSTPVGPAGQIARTGLRLLWHPYASLDAGAHYAVTGAAGVRLTLADE